MSSSNFQLHQTLHGYFDGHRLLKSSRELPVEVERTMLILSDMSGPRMVRGFETYLTGYPLKAIKSYAFARTWYAPEMARPGCVWTHTLIIQNSDLARILDLNPILNNFIRPEPNPKSWEQYSSELMMYPEELSSNSNKLRDDPMFQELALRALLALYSMPLSQVFLSADRASADYELLTIALWSQQWARLRRNFRFCTGSIANRKMYNETFDWQIIPYTNYREIKREVPDAVFIDTRDILNDVPKWASFALGDLFNPQPNELRRFLREFGAETSKERPDFIPLLLLYSEYLRVSQGTERISKLTKLIAKLFPSPLDGMRVKARVFGGKDSKLIKRSPYSLNLSEAALLEELASTEHYHAFDAEVLNIKARAAQLVNTDFNQASVIACSISSSKLTPIGEHYIDGIYEGIVLSNELAITADKFDLLYSLLRQKPELAQSPVLWRVSADEQRKFVKFILNVIRPTNEDIKHIVTAMLNGGSDAVVHDIPRIYRNTVIETLLSWCNTLNETEPLSLGVEWKRLLSFNPDICIKWLKNNRQISSGTLLLLAAILDPNSSYVIKGGVSIWGKVASIAKAQVEGTDLISIMSFLLALGFNNPGAGAVKLVIEAYETVHNAAENNQLSDPNWHVLEYLSPTVSWGGEWDKCERLTGALIDYFMQYRWTHKDFLKCLRNPVLLQKILIQTSAQSGIFGLSKRYRFMRKIANKIFKGKLIVTPAQKELFITYFGA